MCIRALAAVLTMLLVASSQAQYDAQNSIHYESQYTGSAAMQSPRIAQPPALTPMRAYAPAPYPTTGAAIIQPEYLTPKNESVSSGDESIKQLAPAPRTPTAQTIPLAAASPTSPVRKSESTPAPAPSTSEKPSRFWQFVLGPTDDSQTNAPNRPAVTNATAPPASKPDSLSQAGGSLWSQLLGTNAPPPPPSVRPQPETSPFVNPFQLATAEEEVTSPNRQPTLKDIQDAKAPAVSATISSSEGTRPFGGTQPTMQFALPSPPNMAAPNSVDIPTVPTVPGMSSEAASGVAAALRQPFQMTNDAPTAAWPDGPNTPKVAATNRSNRPESETVPSLLQPFYATNEPPRTSTYGTTRANEATAKSPSSITEALTTSSLGRQLTMQSNEDLRTPALASIDAQIKQSEQLWDGTITVQWPLMANPFVMEETAQPAALAQRDVMQTAFQQEPLPTPPSSTPSIDDLGLPGSDDESDESTTADAAESGSDEDKKDTLVGAETLGNAPEDNTLEFLRTQTVLLSPGKHQFDIGLSYTLTENNFPILISDGMGNFRVDEVEFKGRELAVPMELRYGLLRRVQGFVQVPVGWSNVQAAIDNYDEYENDGGLGDIGFGLTAQLRDGYKDCPYIIGTVAGLAPTGGDPFGVVGQISPSAPSLGNGFWAISGNLLWVQTRYDPVVVYYGFGARYQFEHEYFGIEFEPGTEYNYTLGTGFAVNERVTLSAQFFGAYIEEIKANGVRVPGTIQEPMNLRLAATLAKPCNRLVEPFVTFGLTEDAVSANFGITWTY